MSLSGDSPSIIHIATHGYYFEESQAHRFTYYSSFEGEWIPDNDRSGLILANANSSWLGCGQFGWDDGTLTASEINGIDLSRTKLVVLSACQTGLGENNSEDTYGLMRALKNAGARSIIMSLWEVDDRATTVFMTELYEGIASGDEVHDAFIKAQRKVKKEFVNSAYWAAFVLLD